MHLELVELLSSLSLSGEDTEDVEADGLGEGPALANDDLVTGLDTESGGDVCGEVLVALLVTGVLGDEVKVFTADNQGACILLVLVAHFFLIFLLRPGVRAPRIGLTRTVHLGGHDSSGKDTATDGDHAGEWALLVDVGTLNGGLGRTEAQTNVLVPSPGAGVLAGSADLVVEEDVRLSHRISIGRAGGSRNGRVVPASGKRAPTGHYFAISICREYSQYRTTYVSSVAMVAGRVVLSSFRCCSRIAIFDRLCGERFLRCRGLARP